MQNMQLLPILSFLLCVQLISSMGLYYPNYNEPCETPKTKAPTTKAPTTTPPTTKAPTTTLPTTTVPKTECDSGWTAFQRSHYRVCLKVFIEGQMSNDAAEQRCEAYGAVLAGIENKNESAWIHAQALPFLPPGTNRSQLWTAGYRRGACKGPNYDPSCSVNLAASFYWADPYCVGEAGFTNWWCRNPDNVGLKEYCIEFTVQSVPLNLNCITPASINDIACDGSTTQIMGFICVNDTNDLRNGTIVIGRGG